MGSGGFQGDRRAFNELLHDLRQYVAAGILLVEPAESYTTRPEEFARLERLHEVFRRMDELTAMPPAVTRQAWVIDLVQLVDECVSFARITHDVPVDVDGERSVETTCDPVLLRRALTNVLSNAARAAGEKGTIQVRVHSLPGEALVEVSDEGHGFGRIPSVSGHGMSIVQEALRACRGRLEITSGPGPGTTVRMHIPDGARVEEMS